MRRCSAVRIADLKYSSAPKETSKSVARQTALPTSRRTESASTTRAQKMSALPQKQQSARGRRARQVHRQVLIQRAQDQIQVPISTSAPKVIKRSAVLAAALQHPTEAADARKTRRNCFRARQSSAGSAATPPASRRRQGQRVCRQIRRTTASSVPSWKSALHPTMPSATSFSAWASIQRQATLSAAPLRRASLVRACLGASASRTQVLLRNTNARVVRMATPLQTVFRTTMATCSTCALKQTPQNAARKRASKGRTASANAQTLSTSTSARLARR